MTAAGNFPDGSVEYATSITFGVDCGCDGPSPTPADDDNTPVLQPTSPSPIPGIGDDDSDDDSKEVIDPATADAVAVNRPVSVWGTAAVTAGAFMMAVAFVAG